MNNQPTSARLAGTLVPALGSAMRLLPPGALYPLADGVALLAWSLATGRRRAATHNFGRLFAAAPQAPRVRRTARQAFKNFGRMSVDFFTVAAAANEQLLGGAEIAGRDWHAEALRGGRGVILALPHLGNWDLAARLYLALGYPLTAVAEGDWAATFAEVARSRTGLRVVARSHSLRPLLRALARNEAVALIADVAPPGGQSVAVQFAGQRAYLPVGPARLAARTGAPIIPCAGVTLPGGRCALAGTGLLRADPALPLDEQVRCLTQEMARQFEALIRRHPEQWYAFRSLEAVRDAA